MESILETIHQECSLQRGDKILLSFSGGSDSSLLLEALLRVKEALGFELGLFHLHHMLREEAHGDAEFCKKRAQEYALPFHFYKEDIPAVAKKQSLTIEEAARTVRYGITEEVMRDYGYTILATGHNLDDNTETFLMNLLRGSGLRGLGGMSVREGNLIRPLLHTSKEEVYRMVYEYQIPYVEDHTNALSCYRRNKIRHELVPVLESFCMGSFANRLHTTMEILRRDESCLDELVQKSFDLERQDYRISDIISKHESLVYRFLMAKLNRRKDVGTRQLNDCVRLLYSNASGKIAIGGLFMVKSHDTVYFLDEIPEYQPVVSKLSTGIQRFMGYTISCVISEEGIWNEDTISIPVEEVTGDLLLRNRRDADTIHPYGMKGTKKIKDLLIDAKVPQFLRDAIPIIADEHKVYWVIGYRKAHMSEDKKLYYVITARKEDGSLY